MSVIRFCLKMKLWVIASIFIINLSIAAGANDTLPANHKTEEAEVTVKLKLGHARFKNETKPKPATPLLDTKEIPEDQHISSTLTVTVKPPKKHFPKKLIAIKQKKLDLQKYEYRQTPDPAQKHSNSDRSAQSKIGTNPKALKYTSVDTGPAVKKVEYEYHTEHEDEDEVTNGLLGGRVVSKTIKVLIPKPYPVYFERKIHVPLPYPVKVPIDRPYPVHIPKPYPVTIEKKIPYPFPKPVPVYVKVPIKVPYLVKVPIVIEKKVPMYLPEEQMQNVHYDQNRDEVDYAKLLQELEKNHFPSIENQPNPISSSINNNAVANQYDSYGLQLQQYQYQPQQQQQFHQQFQQQFQHQFQQQFQQPQYYQHYQQPQQQQQQYQQYQHRQPTFSYSNEPYRYQTFNEHDKYHDFTAQDYDRFQEISSANEEALNRFKNFRYEQLTNSPEFHSSSSSHDVSGPGLGSYATNYFKKRRH